MAATPIFGIPIPVPGDPADVPTTDSAGFGAIETAIIGVNPFKASSTNRTSSTLTADPDLHAPVAANATYRFSIDLYYGGPAAGGAKIGMTLPSGATANWYVIGLAASVTGASTGIGGWASLTETSSPGLGVNTLNTNILFANARGVLTIGSTAGTFTLTTAQLAVSGTTIFYLGSQLFLEQDDVTVAKAAVKATAQKVAAVTAASSGPNTGLRTGIVTAVDNGFSCDVNLSGSILTLPYLTSYAPVIGDNVQILRTDNTMLVLGAVAPAGTPSGFIRNTPIWSGSGSPALGVVGSGGSISGSYKFIDGMVAFNGQLIIGGSGLVVPGGNFIFNWPIPPSSIANTRGKVIGTAYMEHAATGGTWSGNIISIDQSTLELSVTNTGASGRVTGTAPFTTTVNDRYSWAIFYEAA